MPYNTLTQKHLILLFCSKGVNGSRNHREGLCRVLVWSVLLSNLHAYPSSFLCPTLCVCSSHLLVRNDIRLLDFVSIFVLFWFGMDWAFFEDDFQLDR